jgi:hypothetical protein
VLTEECAAGEFAHPARRGIAMVRGEHDSATTGFGMEDTGDNMRQQQSTKTHRVAMESLAARYTSK